MLSRLSGVLYILAALWLAVAWLFFSRIEPSIGAQAFMVAIIGLPPLAVLAILDFVVTGWHR